MKKKIIRVVQASDENILNVFLKTPQRSATKKKYQEGRKETSTHLTYFRLKNIDISLHSKLKPFQCGNTEH